MKQRPLVFLDLETTGGSPRSSRVLEVGALRVEDGVIVQRYSQLVQPEESIPSFITGLTGIAERDVVDAPTFAMIATELRELLTGAIFVAHNVSFDYGFLQMEYRRLGQSFSADRFCTARLSRALFPEHRRHNLDSIIERHGFVVADRHRAFDDALVLQQFYEQLEQQFGLDVYRVVARLLRSGREPKPRSSAQPLF